ncbi:hypothetical protein L484_000776 [Morus notabilis]|uniref:DUF4228 domain-containing protein n=1 Tax=Morus notabilis TaxID=981085 RepID=W9S5J2_9ROSA|nr:uncharacterized protein LOC21384398 [Morus notabilis]EXC11223.1 hypothetical protein L484_000776 [Morus notabilis]
MGNAAMAPACFKPSPNSTVKLIFFDGTTRILTRKKHIAGEIMFEFPDRMVCPADSFFIGHPVPALGIHDELLPGHTYFVLPIDRFACGVLSAASLAAFKNKANTGPINFGDSPFEYLRGSNGRVLIKVSPEFITRLITRGNEIGSNGSPSNNCGFLCSTPELQKHYEQLVGSKDQIWSPKLETISEHKIRFSPCRFIEWKIKEKDIM